MAVVVEFEYEGRTYRVDGAVGRWNIHAVGLIHGKMELTVDLLTGDRIFVDWSKVGVMRLVSEVDSDGYAVGQHRPPRAGPAAPPPPPPPGLQPAPNPYGEPPVGIPIDAPPPRPGPSVAPGWYPDPLARTGQFRRRYWNGTSWTDQLDE